MYLVTLNTEAAVSKTLYPMCADYTSKEAEDIIRRVDAVSSVVHIEDTIVVQYTAKTLPSALKIALGISNALLQDYVTVRIRDSQDNVVLETLCGLNTAPYGEFNSQYFAGDANRQQVAQDALGLQNARQPRLPYQERLNAL